MWISLRFTLLFLAVPATVFACEGECIVGITKAFIGNYTNPIDAVMDDVAKQIVTQLVPQHAAEAKSYLQPILTAYGKSSYDGMETAIFPSYFHGKCQQNGVDPAGCPNPDCPVVCGTPGSLIHFYSTLRFIAYNQTSHVLGLLSSPGSDAYKQVERAVVQAASSPSPRMLLRYERYNSEATDTMGQNMPYVKKREANVKNGLQDIMKTVPQLLLKACGGQATEGDGALPKCSWEDTMKPYILSFP
ncbi:hypothetical protein BV25DRAFT_300666 [Artomyces pyxidatus]|uniref:Uncharacterized protein n=1 Tax=Artomyces pyxidatus TaxID=48021 RepID=A0ACB8T6X6_9AGAM|nr:hypothetical protein BV25DRAFT_300666 [Artomyces pyxidatus]